jgi:hypothetical protein
VNAVGCGLIEVNELLNKSTYSTRSTEFILKGLPFDKLVKGPKSVMPAKTDIQNYLKILDSAKASLRAPPFVGMTSKDVFRLYTTPFDCS